MGCTVGDLAPPNHLASVPALCVLTPPPSGIWPGRRGRTGGPSHRGPLLSVHGAVSLAHVLFDYDHASSLLLILLGSPTAPGETVQVAVPSRLKSALSLSCSILAGF